MKKILLVVGLSSVLGINAHLCVHKNTGSQCNIPYKHTGIPCMEGYEKVDKKETVPEIGFCKYNSHLGMYKKGIKFPSSINVGVCQYYNKDTSYTDSSGNRARDPRSTDKTYRISSKGCNHCPSVDKYKFSKCKGYTVPTNQTSMNVCTGYSGMATAFTTVEHCSKCGPAIRWATTRFCDKYNIKLYY